jgi:hypothetical protein
MQPFEIQAARVEVVTQGRAEPALALLSTDLVSILPSALEYKVVVETLVRQSPGASDAERHKLVTASLRIAFYRIISWLWS